jgi:outer membrane lipoprotein-sorting protein
MKRKTVVKAVGFVLWVAGACWAGQETKSPEPPQKGTKTDPVEAILEKLNKTTSELTSVECQIEYKYSQPLLESERLSKGTLYYSRSGGTSAMRINFSTLKQDDEKERKYIEQYIVLDGKKLTYPGHEFRGIWLVHLDYQIEQAQYYQLVEPNDPNGSPDVFDLIGRELPMVGFSKIDDLRKQFDVKIVPPKDDASKDFTQVRLDVKPNSVYKDDFVSIDFWIDKKLGLPTKIVAVKTEPEAPYGDIEEIKLLKPKVNKDIDRSVYEFKIPGSFGEPEITPLSTKSGGS